MKKKNLVKKVKCQAKAWDKVFTNYQYITDKKQFLKYIKSPQNSA